MMGDDEMAAEAIGAVRGTAFAAFANPVDSSATAPTRGFAVGSAPGFYQGVGGALAGASGIGRGGNMIAGDVTELFGGNVAGIARVVAVVLRVVADGDSASRSAEGAHGPRDRVPGTVFLASG